jgi:hypothetical protein
MTDVISEQGAMIDGVLNPDATVSRLGGAGHLKSAIAKAIADGSASATASRLGAQGRIYAIAGGGDISFGLSGGSVWSPSAIFASSEVGVWYDPLDIDTLYQDNAGSTAVTAYGQRIGYLRDESGNSNNATQATDATKPLYRGVPRTLGSDIATNGVFAADSDWTKGTDWSIGSGVATKTAGTAANLSQSLSLTAGVTYAIFFYITRTAGTLTPKFSGTTDVLGAAKNLTGSHVEILTAVTGNNAIEFVADATFAGTIDNVVIKPVNSFVNQGAYFDGAQRLATGNINLSAGQQMTIIAALNTSQNVATRMFFEFGNYLSSTAGSVAINLNPNPRAYLRGTASVDVATAATEGTDNNNSTAQIITLAVDLSKGTTAEELVLGSRGIYPTTTPTAGEAGSSNLANGAVSIGAPKNSTQFWKGEVGRVLMVNRLLDSTEYANAVDWVKQGYVYGAAIGDSTIAVNESSVGLALARSVPSFVGGLVSPRATAVCRAGDKIADQKTLWTAIADKTALEVVFIQVGLNDINTFIDVSKTTAQIIADLQDLVDTVNADKPTGCKTYICGLTPCKVWIGNSGGRQAACYQAWLDINEAIAGNGSSPITGVSGRITSHVAALNDGSGNLLTAYDQNGDGVHPSNEAKFIIAQAWRTQLEADRLVE